MTTIVPMMKWEIVVVAQSGSALGRGWLCTIAAKAAKRNQLSATKPFLSSPKSYQQTICRMQNCRFPKISFETRNIKKGSSFAILRQYPVFLQQVRRRPRNRIVWHLALHNRRKFTDRIGRKIYQCHLT